MSSLSGRMFGAPEIHPALSAFPNDDDVRVFLDFRGEFYWRV